jgi:hypothetical protein
MNCESTHFSFIISLYIYIIFICAHFICYNLLIPVCESYYVFIVLFHMPGIMSINITNSLAICEEKKIHMYQQHCLDGAD